MDKEQLLAIFNKQFKEFVEDISRVFPTNTDILTLKVAIVQLLAISPKTIYKTFKKYVVDKYRTEIEGGDINFFIDKDYKSDLSTTGNNTILEKIDCLRGPVREMNPLEQAKVIKYMQNMTKLCDLYEEAS
jgi:hypothetical protein